MSYEVYFWREGDLAIPDQPRQRGLKTPKMQFSKPLAPGTVYFWSVKAKGRYDSAQSETWAFRTTNKP